MQRCPCCNARLRDLELCSRCKADLHLLISCEQAARFWLAKAIQYYLSGNIEQSIEAIGISLHLKKTKLTLIFREFLIQQQCSDILDFLAQKQLLKASRRIYCIKQLLPYSKQLQQLRLFSDYLSVQNQDHAQLGDLGITSL